MGNKKGFFFFQDMDLLRVCLFLLITSISASEQCPEDDDFAKAVAHCIHPIKITNIQFYFDSNVTNIDNGIPIINTNMNDIEHEILENAPNFKSDLKRLVFKK